MKAGWRKIRVAAVTALFLVVPAAGVQADIRLPAGTDLEVVFEEEISSKHHQVNDTVPIRLHGNVEYGDLVVVKDGARGSAVVTAVKPAGRAGKPGRIEVQLVGLEPNGSYHTADDNAIRLKAVESDGIIVVNGKGRKTLSYLFIFGLFIKGTEGVIPPNKPYTAKTTEDIQIVVE